MTEKAVIRRLLPRRAANALFQEGIDTVELIKQRYPEGLLKVPGIGIVSFRAVEAAFFPGQKFDPTPRKYKRSPCASMLSEELSKHLHKTTPEILASRFPQETQAL
ncbi:hypothetical protein [Comamonas koreensis]|uniref:Helix-hairpin-helix domain-containing protein n=1 Tax=Comamonas koreensis TaxID=160825 RepID=A0AAW4XV89_9BURK|nr:hypothetical protein [Comamonas koreensis]MCD2165563.1 hypothetical protein [Comamonas koreensis]